LAASNIVLFSTTTGTLTLGNTGGGNFTINPSVVLATGKTLTTSTTGSILSPAYNSTSATQALSIGTTNTTANVSLATGLTTGTLFIGPDVATSNNAYPQGWSVFNSNVYVISGRRITIDPSGFLFTPNIGNGGSTFAICNQASDNVANITIGSTQSTGNITLGNTTPASDSGTLTINKSVVLPANKTITLNTTGGTITCNTYNGTSVSSQMVIGGNIQDTPITIGAGQTSGNIFLSNTSSTGQVINRAKVKFQTATESSWINTNSANNIFTATSLAGKYITSTTYAAAPTDQWSCWDSNAESASNIDSSAIVQNGNTTMIINPADQQALWWLDEDSFATTTNWAWTGWKISTGGVFTTSSDRRIKRDIIPIVNDTLLDKLSLIQYVNYKKKAPSEDKYYKNGVLRKKYQEVHKGLIAQDVKNIFPEVVERENEDAYWTIKYQEVDVYFNMGVQELIKRDKEKQAQIDDLTTRLARLEQLIIPTV